MIKLVTVAIVAGLFLGKSEQQAARTPVCWTEWFDRDDPSGSGDWETFKELRNENPQKICPNPMAIEATTLSGLSVAAAGENIFKNDKTVGFVCRKRDQPDNECNDYRVRFGCYPPFCDREVTVCWTKWYDRDLPSGTGDWETLKELRNENPGEICANPLYINAVTSFSNILASYTGDNIFINSPTQGFVCRNQDQTFGLCHDYKVRFGCSCRSWYHK